MTSTIPRSRRRWVYLYLRQRDGDKCRVCGRSEEELGNRLDIDHKDGNPTNEAPANLRLLCHSCNTKTAIARRRGDDFSPSLSKKAPTPSADPTTTMKTKVDYQSGSPEMQVNDNAEPEFRMWIVALLLQKEEYPLTDAVADGAEMTGGSLNAHRNYLKKMLSPLYGPLYKFKFAGKGPTRVALKPEVREALTKGALSPQEAAMMGSTVDQEK